MTCQFPPKKTYSYLCTPQFSSERTNSKQINKANNPQSEKFLAKQTRDRGDGGACEGRGVELGLCVWGRGRNGGAEDTFLRMGGGEWLYRVHCIGVIFLRETIFTQMKDFL